MDNLIIMMMMMKKETKKEEDEVSRWAWVHIEERITWKRGEGAATAPRWLLSP